MGARDNERDNKHSTNVAPRQHKRLTPNTRISAKSHGLLQNALWRSVAEFSLSLILLDLSSVFVADSIPRGQGVEQRALAALELQITNYYHSRSAIPIFRQNT